jgi:glycosyltransferase involved in cell wall biosynthesis
MKLFVFNLETDLDSKVLSAAHDWVETFALHFEEVSVFSTHVGRFEFQSNVRVKEVGGGNFTRRLIAIYRIFLAYAQIFKHRKDSAVFHHMSPRTALILGPFVKAIGVPQGLWYSHSYASPSLRLSEKLMSHIYSSTAEALPISTRKAVFVGHGINIARFETVDISKSRNDLSVISVGRIVPIKHLEEIAELNDLEIQSETKKIQITLIGPQPDRFYVEHLRNLYNNLGIQLNVFPAVSYNLVAQHLGNNQFFFTGTPKSVDKAAIEAAIAGCFILSVHASTLETTGMFEVWKHLGLNPPTLISEQVKLIQMLDATEIKQARNVLRSAAISRNDLRHTVLKITRTLNRAHTNKI